MIQKASMKFMIFYVRLMVYKSLLHKSGLQSLYKKISVAYNNHTIEARITDLVNPFGSSFSQKKSKLNKIITELLGEPLAKFYSIEGESGEPFKINIPGNLIDIRY